MKYRLVLRALFFTFTAQTSAVIASPQEFTAQLSALEKKHSGRLGVAVVSGGATLFSYRQDERFAMCSTFKALLAGAILAKVETKAESLLRAIPFSDSDILDYAPITKSKLQTGQMTVAELNAASIQYSDNTAANLLLETIGGPEGLTTYLRSIGDNITRLDRNEPSLNSNIAGDLRDTTTPQAMAETLQKIVIDDYLAPASKEQLTLWMLGNTTGANKLRAGFNPDWMIGDKTGSCANGASNDVAIVFPKELAPFTIAVFYTGSGASNDEKNAVIAEVAGITETMLLERR